MIMFAKLLTIVVACALVSTSLLVIRQRRLDLAHRSSRLHRELQRLESQLWELESDVARRCRPDAVRTAMQRQELRWVPIPDRAPLPDQIDFALAGAADAAPPARSPREG